MFERFTDRARRVLVIAQEEARVLGHDYIGTEHILLGLIAEGEGVAARALESLGAKLPELRAKVEDLIGHGPGFTGSPPFTPGAKKVLELSLREALQLGHSYIGTEHLLLALVRDGGGDGARLLEASGVELSQVREVVVKLIKGYAAGSDLVAVESDRVEKVDLPLGAGALLGSEEARDLIASWIDVRQKVSQSEVDGVVYEIYSYRPTPPADVTVAVVGAKVTREAFHGYSRLVPDAEAVPNLGDLASFSPQRRLLRVLSGETVIVVRVTDHPRPREAAIEVATLALANLAGGEPAPGPP